MRITSGKFRSRSLVSPRTDITHPMGDRERLALFNVLESRGFKTDAKVLYGGVRTAAAGEAAPSAHGDGPDGRVAIKHLCASPKYLVLDAYAGTGALGLEALSRGATYVDFIEKDRRALVALRQNIQTLDSSAKTQVFPTSVVKFVAPSPYANKHGGYNLIFIDPPYDHFCPADFVHLCKFLKPGGILILSHPAAFTPEGLLQLIATQTPAVIKTASPATSTPNATPSLVHLSTRSYARANISLFRSVIH